MGGGGGGGLWDYTVISWDWGNSLFPISHFPIPIFPFPIPNSQFPISNSYPHPQSQYPIHGPGPVPVPVAWQLARASKKVEFKQNKNKRTKISMWNFYFKHHNWRCPCLQERQQCHHDQVHQRVCQFWSIWHSHGWIQECCWAGFHDRHFQSHLKVQSYKYLKPNLIYYNERWYTKDEKCVI